MLPRDIPLWEDAKPYLDVRNNDEHTLVAYGLARALLEQTPGADESTVLPAILLHDVGWKRVDPNLLLDAIGTNPTRKDLVFDHERYGVEIASEILTRHRPDDVNIKSVLEIIDGHDTTKEARSINDAVVKDADKGWRTTPHGMKIICGWYDWSIAEYLDAMEKVAVPHMLTPAGKALASCLVAARRAEAALPDYLEERAHD